jgi:serine/threonine protein phosphatase PrpC
MLKDEDMARVLAAGGDAQAMADSLVALANAAGGEDNISLVVVALPES